MSPRTTISHFFTFLVLVCLFFPSYILWKKKIHLKAVTDNILVFDVIMILEGILWLWFVLAFCCLYELIYVITGLYVQLFIFVLLSYFWFAFPALMVAFLGSSCNPVDEPCVFNNPIDAILGLFSMSVGDFEDIIQTFPSSRYSVLVYVSHI